MNTNCSHDKTGAAFPRPKNKIRIQITLSEELSRKLKDCQMQGLSYSTVVELALVDYFARNRGEA